MLSYTWNAPVEALTDPSQFFQGKGGDSIHGPIIKSHLLCGIEQIPSFQCNDVLKNPEFERYITEYEAHLKKYFTI